MSRIALMGNLSLDRVAGGPPRAGGGVFWAARAAARVGADAAVAPRCAPRDRDVALAPLEALGLPVVCGDARSTTAFSFHYEGDRRVMTVDAVGDAWSPEDVDGWAAEALAGAEWALVAGLLRTDFPAETVAALARGGRRLALDGQGLVRLARTGPLSTDASVDRSTLAELAVLTLNEEEAETLVGGAEPERLHTLGVREVVLTLGSRGAVVVADGEATHIAPQPVDGAVEPTGAGDAFALQDVEGGANGATPGGAGGSGANSAAETPGQP